MSWEWWLGAGFSVLILCVLVFGRRYGFKDDESEQGKEKPAADYRHDFHPHSGRCPFCDCNQQEELRERRKTDNVHKDEPDVTVNFAPRSGAEEHSD